MADVIEAVCVSVAIAAAVAVVFAAMLSDPSEPEIDARRLLDDSANNVPHITTTTVTNVTRLVSVRDAARFRRPMPRGTPGSRSKDGAR